MLRGFVACVVCCAYSVCRRCRCRFDSVSDLLEPQGDGSADGCYISKSYDATSHFETAANDVLSLYQRITGTELDMTISADMNEDEDA